jgi:mRNA-degrading endonuclease toxin of MazEF toxin-antitoxin module
MRPVLVVSPTAFNRLTRTPVVLPITSGGNFARTAGFTVSLMGVGTQTTGVVRCDQPRALDIASRHGRKLESVPQAILDEVLAKVAPLFE